MPLSKLQATAILQSKIDLIPSLRNGGPSSPQFTKWKRDVEIAIEHIFGKEGRHLKDFRGVSYEGIVAFDVYGDRTTPDEEILGTFQRGLARAKNILESMIEEIQTYWPDEQTEKPETATEKRYTDRELMERAIELAKQCVSEPGKVSPKVGAVLARDGIILGEAYRGELKPGEHAEYTLLEGKLRDADVVGSTLFTTLEPCTTRNHPKVPCADRVTDRKIAKVFIGTLDRNDDIRGRGEFHLTDSGVQIGRFDSDLMTVLEDLNREFIRNIRQRTKAETTDPVGPEAVGPNGFRIGYTENGDKVEWIEEDGETWPMVLRRNDNDILKEYNELWEKVWYIRKIIRIEKIEAGEIPPDSPIPRADKRMREIEEKYGKENLGWDDIEWGLIQGRMSALSWVMGAEWDESLDT
jgi:pyrimidine deaminase RibD-like protein